MSKKNLDIIEIGSRLKEVRKALNLSLKDVADISGYSISTISEVERDINNPNPRYLLLLAKKFNVNLNWLFTGKGAMFNPDFEIKWDFGKDNEMVMKLIYLIENCSIVRYDILGHFIKSLDANADIIEKVLSDQKK